MQEPVDWLALRERGPLSCPCPPALVAHLLLEYAFSLGHRAANAHTKTDRYPRFWGSPLTRQQRKKV
eukprot:scaffold293317_cov56-Attheya_sp.AAC.2